TVTKSAAWLILLQVGAFAGYISFGWFADRFGRRLAFTAFMIAATAVVPIFAFGARSPITLLTIGPLVGYFAHGYFSLFGTMLAELFPTRFRASAQGFCYNGGRLASAAAPFAIGAAQSMTDAVRRAKRYNVTIGAHPSYPDRANFGRTSMTMAPPALRTTLIEQIKALGEIADRERVPMRHVKPHGALYNDAHKDV